MNTTDKPRALSASDLFASGFDLGTLRKRINSSIAKAKFKSIPKAQRSNSADRRGGEKTMKTESTTPAPKVGSSAIVRLEAALNGQITLATMINEMEAEMAEKIKEAQSDALAEARLRIIARYEENDRWGDPLGHEGGLKEARRIIGAMWDDLPISKPQAVIDHERGIRAAISEPNNELSLKRASASL